MSWSSIITSWYWAGLNFILAGENFSFREITKQINLYSWRKLNIHISYFHFNILKPKAYIQLVVNYKATRTPPKFQIRNKGAFIYYVINIGGGGVSQMLMFVDMGGGGCWWKDYWLCWHGEESAKIWFVLC